MSINEVIVLPNHANCALGVGNYDIASRLVENWLPDSALLALRRVSKEWQEFILDNCPQIRKKIQYVHLCATVTNNLIRNVYDEFHLTIQGLSRFKTNGKFIAYQKDQDPNVYIHSMEHNNLMATIAGLSNRAIYKFDQDLLFVTNDTEIQCYRIDRGTELVQTYHPIQNPQPNAFIYWLGIMDDKIVALYGNRCFVIDRRNNQTPPLIIQTEHASGFELDMQIHNNKLYYFRSANLFILDLITGRRNVRATQQERNFECCPIALDGPRIWLDGRPYQLETMQYINNYPLRTRIYQREFNNETSLLLKRLPQGMVYCVKAADHYDWKIYLDEPVNPQQPTRNDSQYTLRSPSTIYHHQRMENGILPIKTDNDVYIRDYTKTPTDVKQAQKQFLYSTAKLARWWILAGAAIVIPLGILAAAGYGGYAGWVHLPINSTAGKIVLLVGAEGLISVTGLFTLALFPALFVSYGIDQRKNYKIDKERYERVKRTL